LWSGGFTFVLLNFFRFLGIRSWVRSSRNVKCQPAKAKSPAIDAARMGVKLRRSSALKSVIELEVIAEIEEVIAAAEVVLAAAEEVLAAAEEVLAAIEIVARVTEDDPIHGDIDRPARCKSLRSQYDLIRFDR